MTRNLLAVGLIVLVAAWSGLACCAQKPRDVDKACAGQQTGVTGKEAVSTSTPEVEDGTSLSASETGLSAAAELPEGWPVYVPLIPGAEIVEVMQSPDGNPQIHLRVEASVDEVSKYYDENLAGYGWKEIPNKLGMRTTSGFRLSFERQGELLRIFARADGGSTDMVMVFVPGTSGG